MTRSIRFPKRSINSTRVPEMPFKEKKADRPAVCRALPARHRGQPRCRKRAGLIRFWNRSPPVLRSPLLQKRNRALARRSLPSPYLTYRQRIDVHTKPKKLSWNGEPPPLPVRVILALTAALILPFASRSQTSVTHDRTGNLLTINAGSNAAPVLLNHPRSTVTPIFA